MNYRTQLLSPLAMCAAAVLSLAGQALAQCSITSGGACDGTCPKPQVCASDGKDSYSCSCQTPKKGGGAALGSIFDAGGGTISFNGSQLIVAGMTVIDVYDKPTGTFVPGDPIIGADIVFPTMTLEGLHTFDNGIAHFDYFDFKNLSGNPFQVRSGSTVYLSASIDDTWYLLDRNSFSGNDLSSIVYDSSVNSHFLNDFSRYSSIAQPTTVVVSGLDFRAGSANFTQSFSAPATEVASECASTPEPGCFLLIGAGLTAIGIISRKRRGDRAHCRGPREAYNDFDAQNGVAVQRVCVGLDIGGAGIACAGEEQG